MQGEKARWVWNRQSTAVRSFRLSGKSVGSGGLLHLYRSIPVYVDSEIGAERRSRRLRAAAAEQKALPSVARSRLVCVVATFKVVVVKNFIIKESV